MSFKFNLFGKKKKFFVTHDRRGEKSFNKRIKLKKYKFFRIKLLTSLVAGLNELLREKNLI